MECINKVLRKSGKTVVLVTHAIQYLPQCDKVCRGTWAPL